MHLYEALGRQVTAWRERGYKHEENPAIGEILERARHLDVPLFRLRASQIKALETYWYLRLVEKTPHILLNRADLKSFDRKGIQNAYRSMIAE